MLLLEVIAFNCAATSLTGRFSDDAKFDFELTLLY